MESQVTVRHTLGWRLGQARREKAARDGVDIQQQDVALAVGASRASVSKWESDVDVPREAALAKLADYLGVTPAYLRYGVVEPALPTGVRDMPAAMFEPMQSTADRAAAAKKSAKKRA